MRSVAPSPNIILIILDSARRDIFGCYGHEGNLTPNIDRLAQEGLILNDHYAAGCGSTQAHVSMFLGQHSYRHGMVHNMSEMKQDVVAFPRLLQKAGYETFGHCMASFIPPAGYEDIFGFNEFYYPGKSSGTTAPLSIRNKVIGLLRRNPTLWSFLKNLYKKTKGQASLIRAAARNFDGQASLDYLFRKLTQGENGKPVFAYTTLLHPHTPYYPPQWCLDQVFQGEPIDPLSFDIQSDLHGWVNGDYGPVQSAIDAMKRCYEAELLYADHLVGNFVSQLRANGTLDNTILIITSDHGEFFGEDGWLNHGATVRDELYRIPCIIRYPPRISPGSSINYLTSALDLAPTIFDLAGNFELIKRKTHLDGIALFSDEVNDGRVVFVDSPPIVLPERLKKYKNVLAKACYFYRAVRNHSYKYVWRSDNKRYLFRVGDFECDDNNIIAINSQIAETMHADLVNFYSSIDPSFEISHYPINMGTTAAMKMTDPKIRQELIKLGYL